MAKDPMVNVLAKIKDEQDLVIRQLGDSNWPKVERISSGSLALDYALGGGWPRGRCAELFGVESGGKSMMSLSAIAEAQKLGGRASLMDYEGCFDPEWSAKQGVNVNELFISQPETAEQGMGALINMVQSNTFDLIAIDSVAAMMPKATLEGSVDDKHMAELARIMSQSLGMLTPYMSKSKTVVLFINQIRSTMTMYGNPTTTPGGMALKFYSSVRVQVSRESKSERVNDRKEMIGHNINAKVVKNKTAQPFRVASVPILYLGGVIKDEDFINACSSRGLLVFSGGVKYQGTAVKELAEMKWKSWDDVKQWVINSETDPKILKALRDELVGM